MEWREREMGELGQSRKWRRYVGGRRVQSGEQGLFPGGCFQGPGAIFVRKIPKVEQSSAKVEQ